MIKGIVILTLAFIFSLLASCNDTRKKQPASGKDSLGLPKDISIPGSFTPESDLRFDSLAIKMFADSFPNFKSILPLLDSFYRARHYSFAWFDKMGMIEPAFNLYNHTNNIAAEGISGSLPYHDEFMNLIELQGNKSKPSANLDLMLTAQYMSYAKLVWDGVTEKATTAQDWLLPRKETHYNDFLDSLLTGKDVLREAPVYRQYFLLKKELERYNAIKEAGGFPKIPEEKRSMKKGDSSSSILLIRQYLFLSGDAPIGEKTIFFDSTLAQSVKSFQRRLGLKENGIISPGLVKEMNVPVDARIGQLIVNMERCRWVPVRLTSEYLLVNIPDFKLYVYDGDSLLWGMNVVVGKDQHKTVIFNGDLKFIVFSPYWNIPSSILKNEVLPAMARNKNYLLKHNMEWNGGRVRQKPGPNNSLGLVKFLFPNEHNIYLHDSPAKSLFNEDSRAFSHGCIRLAQPKKLAAHLLRNDRAWTSAKIDSAMNSGKEQYVQLKKPVPVFIAYFTAWVDRAGALHFRKDIYNRDNRLLDMIVKRQ